MLKEAAQPGLHLQNLTSLVQHEKFQSLAVVEHPALTDRVHQGSQDSQTHNKNNKMTPEPFNPSTERLTKLPAQESSSFGMLPCWSSAAGLADLREQFLATITRKAKKKGTNLVKVNTWLNGKQSESQEQESRTWGKMHFLSIFQYQYLWTVYISSCHWCLNDIALSTSCRISRETVNYKFFPGGQECQEQVFYLLDFRWLGWEGLVQICYCLLVLSALLFLLFLLLLLLMRLLVLLLVFQFRVVRIV